MDKTNEIKIASTENKSDKKKKKKKNKKPRCAHPECKNKLLITDMKCACGLTFCSKHRTKTQHNCSNSIINKDIFMQKNGLGGGDFKKLEVI